MKYDIRLLKEEEKVLLDDLCVESGTNFIPFIDCEYLVASNGTPKLLGALAFYTTGRHPCFQHLILSGTAPRKLGVILIKRLEDLLRAGKFDVYCVYVENKNNYLQQMAINYGYTPYNQDDEGVWYFKKL